MSEPEIAATGASTAVTRTSKLAITAFVLAILSLPTVFLTAIPAMFCGICSVLSIRRSGGKLKGKKLALLSIILPPLILMLSLVFDISPRAKIGTHPSWMRCRVNLHTLAVSMHVYAYDHNDRLPEAESWCDLLIMFMDCDTRWFVCPGSEALEGESTYALNHYAIGYKWSELPPDMVLLFETKAGLETESRTFLVKNRRFFDPFPNKEDSPFGHIIENCVYPDRWNQVGGPEILTTKYHNGKGCNIAFVNGEVRYVHSDKLHTLRWTPD